MEKVKTKKRPPRTIPKKWQQQNVSSPHHVPHHHLSRRSNNNHYPGDGGDARSKSSGDGASSGNVSTKSTPSSVLVSGHGLSRDLSDLSGSYHNGTGGSKSTTRSARSHHVAADYLSDQSATSYNRPWAQARILSSREPLHPQPRQDCDDDSCHKSKIRTTMCLQNQKGLVGIIKGSDEETSNSSHDEERMCIPLLILLMDPGRKTYEIMQVWIDMEEDTVRDTLHALRLCLAERTEWKQDYDGLFQVRNNTFSQLINILNVSKYDIRPFELIVAKPWSMAAKDTVQYAGELLSYLKGIGLFRYVSSHEIRSRGIVPKLDDSILVLTQEAKSRIYVPGEIQKQHHAIQFLSFSPTFEPIIRVDVLSGMGGDEEEDDASQLSDSQGGQSVDSSGNIVLEQKPSVLEELRIVSSRSPSKSMAHDRPFEASWNGSKNIFKLLNEPQEEGLEMGLKLDEEPYRHQKDRQMTENKTSGNLRKALAMLSCAAMCGNRKKSVEDKVLIYESGAATVMESMNSTQNFARNWEDASSLCDKSIVSDSAPLLLYDRETGKTKERLRQL